MRLDHFARSFTLAAVVLCAALSLAVYTPAWALTISSPTEGQAIRGQVAIVIPRSSLSNDVAASGFIAVKINGRFCAAIGTSDIDSDNAPAKPNLVYVWDSKSVVGDAMRGDAIGFPDGKYEITIDAHSTAGKDTIVGTAKVNVTLKNQIDQANPPVPVNLSYKYMLGQVSNFKFTTSAEVFDKYGFSLSGGQPPIMGEFVIGQSVEDARRDSTALIRYKVDKDEVPYAQVLGTVNMLGQNQKFRSIYRILDESGKVLEANVFTTKTTGDVADCLVTLPGNSVKKGTTWLTTFHLRIEGISDGVDLTGQSYFDSLEWESGTECAKIVSNWTGNMTFPALQIMAVPVKATSNAYFAYKTRKLIKHVITIEFSANVGSDIITKLQSTVPAADASSGSTPSSGGSASPSYTPPSGMYAPPPSGMYAPTPSYSAPAASSSTNDGSATPVKVLLKVVEELVGK